MPTTLKRLPFWMLLLLVLAFAGGHQLSTVWPDATGVVLAQDDPDDPDDPDDDDDELADSVEAGVRIDAQKMLRVRAVASGEALRAMHQRVRRHARHAGQTKLVYIALPRAFAEARRQLEAEGEIEAKLRHLAGLTRIKHVFVYPEAGQLVIAGPSEPVDATEPHRPAGERTGRPVVQLTDLVDMLRLAAAGEEKIGCSLDPAPKSMERAQAVARRYGSISRGERKPFVRDMKEAMGGQTVRLFGVSDTSRAAQVCLVADYRMKRQALGLAPIPVRGMTHAIARRAKAAGRFWFESSYEAIRQSEGKRVYALEGARLQVKSGRLMFQEGGASRQAKAFATNFTRHMAKMTAAEPAYADLQNVTDLFLLAHLIDADELDERVDWDWRWAKSAEAWPTPRFKAPQTAEPLVSFRNRSIAAGGVSITVQSAIDNARQTDESGKLAGLMPDLPETGWFWYDDASEGE